MKQYLLIDIGGTFTDCFVAWGERVVEAKSLTTHHSLGHRPASYRELDLGQWAA